MSSAVHVNSHAHAVTHVSTGLIRGLRRIVKESGLDPAKMTNQWPILENGVETWLESRHLRSLVLEIHDPSRRSGDDLVGRFDFTIDYGYYPEADGELWLDPDTVYYTVRKAGAVPSRCDYRIVADNKPGRPDVAGWSTTSLRSTAGFTRHEVGTAIGGGSLGAGLSYYARTGS
ncbi:HORMA domain containing protein [Streptomyces sp. NPDC093509]|uniref:HORMA domain containing protein n=1 Tax=Streptomyces sp. NPDC093509 TaxID=3154982 RepID=UPI00344B16A0